MLRGLLLWASENRWCRESLPRYRFVRRAVRRFMPGEEAEDALRESATLRDSLGAPTILTLLGENVTDPTESQGVVGDYVALLAQIAAQGLSTQISIKPTHLGLDLSLELAQDNLRRLAIEAQAHDNFVWVDMEGSAYVDLTLDMFTSIRREHNNLGICLQAYLHRTADDLERLAPLRPSVRLVKGAYLEPPEVAMPDKRNVDESFYRLSCRLLEADALADGARPGFATHDTDLIRRITEEADNRGVDRQRYEFQMLYGIARGEQRRLVADGREVRVLISYGHAWFPWYMRRLAERPANLWFVVRSAMP